MGENRSSSSFVGSIVPLIKPLFTINFVMKEDRAYIKQTVAFYLSCYKRQCDCPHEVF